MNEETEFCKHLGEYIEGVHYPPFAFERVGGILLCSECRKAVSRCCYCSKPAWGVYIRGYFCYDHRPSMYSHLDEDAI